MSAEEIARLQAEVEHWKAHADEAGRGFSEVCKTAARLSARNVELVRTIETLADEWQQGGWTVLTEKVKAGSVIGAAQVVTDWLRTRPTAPGRGALSLQPPEE